MSRAKEQKPNLPKSAEIDPFRAQHLSIATARVQTDDGPIDVTIDESESPLGWLARRKGRDGKPLIEPAQFQAGERLRVDFTRANLTPNITSSWDVARAQGRRGQSGGGTFTDAVVAAREQLNLALEAVGPEFAGVLLDVCCFLKGLEDVERERRWPQRSAKIILQLGLDRLARHYGLSSEVRAVRTRRSQRGLTLIAALSSRPEHESRKAYPRPDQGSEPVSDRAQVS